MPSKIMLTTLEDKRAYVHNWLGRAKCHREDYLPILSALIGYLFAFSESGWTWEGTQTNGNLGIKLAFRIGDEWYAVRYINPDPGYTLKITDYDGNKVLLVIEPDTKPSVVFHWFDSLRAVRCGACNKS